VRDERLEERTSDSVPVPVSPTLGLSGNDRFGVAVPAEGAEDLTDGVKEEATVIALSVVPLRPFELLSEAVIFPLVAHEEAPSLQEARISVTNSWLGVPGTAIVNFDTRSSVATIKTQDSCGSPAQLNSRAVRVRPEI